MFRLAKETFQAHLFYGTFGVFTFVGIFALLTGRHSFCCMIQPFHHTGIQLTQLQGEQILAAQIIQCHDRWHNIVPTGLSQQRAVIASTQITGALTKINHPHTLIRRRGELDILVESEHIRTGVIRRPILVTINNNQKSGHVSGFLPETGYKTRQYAGTANHTNQFL